MNAVPSKEFCNRGRGLSAAIEETASHSSITIFLSPKVTQAKVPRLGQVFNDLLEQEQWHPNHTAFKLKPTSSFELRIREKCVNLLPMLSFPSAYFHTSVSLVIELLA